MAEAPPPGADSLSARAQEILRRADAQLAALHDPARTPAPHEPAPAPPSAPGPPPLEAQDVGGLLDAVQSGIEAAGAHLAALSEAVERIAREIEPVARAHRPTVPPQLEGYARLPEELADQTPPPDRAVAPDEKGPDPPSPGPPSPNAAHNAARLVAIEMAVAGDTREGVGRRLREEFGIRDPGSILDDAFGPDTHAPGRGSYGT